MHQRRLPVGDVKGQVSDISLKTDKQNQGDRFLNR